MLMDMLVNSNRYEVNGLLIFIPLSLVMYVCAEGLAFLNDQIDYSVPDWLH